jgi:hypothetical protein
MTDPKEIKLRRRFCIGRWKLEVVTNNYYDSNSGLGTAGN